MLMRFKDLGFKCIRYDEALWGGRGGVKDNLSEVGKNV